MRKVKICARLLKNKYNYKSLYKLALSIKDIYDLFQIDDFVNGGH